MKIRSRHRLNVCLACLLALGLAACAGRGTTDPRPVRSAAATRDEPVVARVNDAPIFARQLEGMLQADRLRPRAGETPAPEADVRSEALDLLIGGELLYQAAVAAGLRIPPRELDRLVGASRSQFGSDEEYQAFLESEGLTERRVRRQVERRELMRAYASRVTDDLVIDDEQAREIYEERKDEFLTPEQMRAAFLLDPVSRSDSAMARRQAREALESIRRRVVGGESFRALAAKHAAASGAMAQLDSGFTERGRLPSEVEDVAFATPVGELTPVIETPRGYYLLKILERRAARQRTFDEVRTSLLMLLARDQKDATLREHVQELREAATIVIVPTPQ